MINRMGFNNRGPGGGVRAARSDAATGAGSSASTSAPTRTARTASPIMSPACSAMSAGRRLSDDQHQLAQHAGPAPAAGRGRAAGAARRRSARRAIPTGPPIFLKVAPDLGEGEPDQIVRAAICTATSTRSSSPIRPCRGRRSSRDSRASRAGLSGAPLKAAGARRRCAISARRRAAKSR